MRKKRSTRRFLLLLALGFFTVSNFQLNYQVPKNSSFNELRVQVKSNLEGLDVGKAD